MTIRTLDRLFVCLSWWPYNARAHLRNLFYLKGGKRAKDENQILRNRDREWCYTTTLTPFEQQLDTEPDKYKRITSRKIIVIIFLSLVRFCFVVAVTVLLLLHWLSSNFGWMKWCEDVDGDDGDDDDDNALMVWYFCRCLPVFVSIKTKKEQRKKKHFTRRKSNSHDISVEINIGIFTSRNLAHFFTWWRSLALFPLFRNGRLIRRNVLLHVSICINWQLSS